MSLHDAAFHAKVRDLKKELDKGADPNAKDENARSPLLLLLQASFLIPDKKKLTACAKLLLDAGADPNVIETKDEQTRGESLLMLAVRDELGEVIDALIEKGANVKYRSPGGRTAMILATERGAPMAIQERLLAAGGVRKNYTLAQASRAGDLNQVTELLAQGVPADEPDKQGTRPLEYAAMYGHEAVLDALLSAGCDAHALNNRENLLVAASCSGIVAICKRLLGMGLDVNGGEKSLTTPLMNAAAYGHLEVAQLLIAAGADVAVKKHMGETALKMARMAPKENRKQMIELLQGAGVAVDPAFEAAKTIREAAESAEFKQWAETLAQTLKTKSKPWSRRKGVLQYNVGKLKQLAIAWSAAERADLNGAEYPAVLMLQRLQEEAREAGYQLTHEEPFAGHENFAKLLLFPIADQYAILVANGTNGANYGLDTNDIIGWLRRMEKANPFVITACGHDFVGGRFTTSVRKSKTLAEEMVRFCPEMIDGDEITSAADVAAGLKAEGTFFFWWD